MKIDGKEVSLFDSGSRYEHLVDLMESWKRALLSAEGQQTKFYNEQVNVKIHKLTAAVEMLEVFMTGLGGFDKNKDHFGLRDIPLDPEKIPSSRGTPLKVVDGESNRRIQK